MTKFDKIILFGNDMNLKIYGKDFFDIEAKAFCKIVNQYFSEKNLLLNSIKTKYLSFYANNTSKSAMNTMVSKS